MTRRNPSLTFLTDQIAYSGFRRQEYEKIRQQIYEKNYSALIWMSLVGLVALIGLFVSSLFFPALASFQSAYIILIVILAVILVLARFWAAGNKKRTMPLIYFALSSALIFGIALGTFLHPGMPAVSFFVLLFGLPLILTDKPYRCCIMLVAATAAFCLCAWAFKPREIYGLDIVNAVCFCLVSVVSNQFLMHTKLSSLISRLSIARERDTDGLTKLLNRTAGQKEILEYIGRGRETAILIMLDIDNFKSVNDACGHAVGDDSLRMIGACIRETFRQSDILVRFGGDEFLVFMPYVLDRDCVRRRVDALRESISAHTKEYEGVPQLSFSTGVSIYPHDANAYNELLKMADDALGFSKKYGSEVCFYRDCFGNGKQSNIPVAAKA